MIIFTPQDLRPLAIGMPTHLLSCYHGIGRFGGGDKPDNAYKNINEGD